MIERIVKKYGKLISNVGFSFGSKIIAMILFLLIDIALVRLLSFEEYDEWSFFYAFSVICYNVARLGLNSSTKVHVANGENAEEKRSMIWSGLIMRCVASLFMGTMSLLLLLLVNKLGYPDNYPNLYGLVTILPFLIVFYTVLDFFKETNVGLNRFVNIFIISILEFGLSLAFIVLLNVKQSNNLKVAYGYVLGYAATSIVGFVLIRKFLFQKDCMQFKMGRGMKQILKFAFPMYMSNLIGCLLVEMDTFMLGLFRPGETGIYSIAKNLVTKATNLNLAICVGTMAQLAIVNRSNIKQQKDGIKKVLVLNGIITAGVCLIIVFIGNPMIKILYGEGYAESGNVMKCLLVYYVCYATSIFPSTFISYQKQSKVIMKNNALMFVLNLVFSLILIPGYGAVGASVAAGMAILPYTFLMFRFQKKIIRTIENEGKI